MNDVERALTNLGDLSVPATAATERFVGAAGKLVDIAYTTMDSPIGVLLLAASPAGLLRIGFDNETAVLTDLADRVSPRILEFPDRLAGVKVELREYFAGRRDHFNLPARLDPHRRLPSAHTRGHSPYPLWQRVDVPGRCRAGGSAKGCQGGRSSPGRQSDPGHHPLPPGPAERGGLGGYAGGTDRKAYLLRLEGSVL